MAFISEGRASETITDSGSGMQVFLGFSVGNVVINGWGSDPAAHIQLLNVVNGGYSTTAAALAALTSDGHGGTSLALPGTGSVDFAGVAPSSLTASNLTVSASWSGGHT
jgi:hypothetical protein